MWYARGLWPTACLLVASLSVAAQTTFHNDGNVVHVSPRAVVFVQGGLNNHNDGLLANGGTIHFSDDWSSNTALSDDVASLGGTFVLEGDYQSIYGSQEVTFPNVAMTPASIRAQQRDVDVVISGTLDLLDGEWYTGSTGLHVTNPDPLAISRREGFVSSDSIGGYLTRTTDREADYVYPVGSTGATLRTGIARYRPVVIRPLGASVDDDYAVRFANISASNDFTDGGTGFDLENRDPSLTDINRAFYRMVDRLRGTSLADIHFYFVTDDGKFSTVAQREEDGQWWDGYGEVTVNATPRLYTDALDKIASLYAHDDFLQPIFTEAGADADDDGIADRLDLDADNDGIANVDEVNQNPYGDHDGDRLFDYLDPDNPNCGGLVSAERPVCINYDFDRDGIADHLDLDSDGDGIYDIVEAGGVDLDFDAQVDDYTIPGLASSMPDQDRDGFSDTRDHLVGGQVADASDEITSGTPWPQGDRDNDGLKNFRDVDSDGDGIVDWVEGQQTVLFAVPRGVDDNRNGIDAAFDYFEASNNGTYVVVPHNTDGVDQPDYLDLNSDNERTSDLYEGNATAPEGILVPSEFPSGFDADGDGLDDRFDNVTVAAEPRFNPTNGTAATLKPAERFPQFQNGATREPDFREVDCPQQDCQTLQTTRNQQP